MTNQWQCLCAYTTHIDALLVELVGPFFEANRERVAKGFWRRHYAGGPQVRIYLQAERQQLRSMCATLRANLEVWLARHPSVATTHYSPSRAAELLRREGIDPATEDLSYHDGVVLEREYPDAAQSFASVGARELAEAFRQHSGPLAIEILRRPQSRQEAVFELYLALALFIGRGSYVSGSVSFKSHWEGFYATLENAALLDKVAVSYANRQQRLVATAEMLLQQWRNDLAFDPLTHRWWQVLTATSSQAQAMLRDGQTLVAHFESVADAIAGRERLFSRMQRSSAFVETLWANEQFMSVVHRDHRFQLPRALVNLLYDFVAAVGLTPLDKMVMCHHAHRVAEALSGCDLNEQLQANMRAVLARHGTAQPGLAELPPLAGAAPPADHSGTGGHL